MGTSTLYQCENCDLKINRLTTKEQIDDNCLNVFEEKCKGDKMYGWFVERYLPIIS